MLPTCTCRQTPQSLLCCCRICVGVGVRGAHSPTSLVGAAAELLQQLGQQPPLRLLEHQTGSNTMASLMQAGLVVARVCRGAAAMARGGLFAAATAAAGVLMLLMVVEIWWG